MNSLMQILESNDFGNEKVNFSDPKIAVNNIRKIFSAMSEDVYNKVSHDFEEIFPDPDMLHFSGDLVADEVRCNAIDVAMNIITGDYEIYDITEEDFRSDYVMPNDNWDEYFSEIEEQFGEIIDNEIRQEAYRQYRKENRTQYVGYNFKGSLKAGALNALTGFAHDVWNNMERSVENEENEDRKQEIYEDESNRENIAFAMSKIPMVVFEATITFLDLRRPCSVYIYSEEEKKKERGIMEHVNKGRVKKENLLSVLTDAIKLYPYDIGIYISLLENFGDADKKIENFVTFLGLGNLNSQKKSIFEKKLIELKNKNFIEKFSELEEFIKLIGYKDGEKKLEKIKSNEKIEFFNSKIKNINIARADKFIKTFKELEELINIIQYPEGIKIVEEIKSKEKIKLFNAKIKSLNLNSLEKFNENYNELKKFAETIEYPEGIQVLENKKTEIITEEERIKKLPHSLRPNENNNNSNNTNIHDNITQVNNTKKKFIIPAVIMIFIFGGIFYNYATKSKNNDDVKQSLIEYDNTPKSESYIDNNVSDISNMNHQNLDVEQQQIMQDNILPEQEISNTTQEINNSEVETMTTFNENNNFQNDNLDEIYDEDADDDRPPAIDRGSKSK